jgi:hypothetical protein
MRSFSNMLNSDEPAFIVCPPIGNALEKMRATQREIGLDYVDDGKGGVEYEMDENGEPRPRIVIVDAARYRAYCEADSEISIFQMTSVARLKRARIIE